MKQLKLILTICLLFFYGLSFSQVLSQAVIKGTVKNFDKDIFLTELDESNELRIDRKRSKIQPDSAGQISLVIPLDEAGYYVFANNTLYLSPGDSLSFVWNASQERRITFEGNAAIANNYLKDIVYGGSGSYLKGGDEVQATVEETIDYVLSESKQSEERLDSLNGVPENFMYMEKGRIRSDRLNSLILLLGMFKMVNDLSAEDYKVLLEQYSFQIDNHLDDHSKEFMNADLLVFDSYRRLLYYLINMKNNNTVPMRISEWRKAKGIVNRIKKESDREIIKSYESDIGKIMIPEYKNVLSEVFQSFLAFGSGDKAIDFVANDFDGNPVNLKDFKGKVIYLEFWATWCMPCIKEFGPLDSLHTSYEGNEDIVIISVSIDKDVEAWKSNLEKRQPKTLQLIIHPDDLKDYLVKTIPRSIIIDKDFNVNEMFAKPPSSQSISENLLQLAME